MRRLQQFVLFAGLAALLFATGCGTKIQSSTRPQHENSVHSEDSNTLDTDVIPDDFELIACYKAGFSSWKSWTNALRANGQVEWKPIDGQIKENNATKLTKEEMSTLWTKVQGAQFFKLKKYYRADDITDQSTISLKITAKKQTHEVAVYAFQLVPAKDRDEVNRFLQIYAEVIRLVPPPNSEQKPSDYAPIKRP